MYFVSTVGGGAMRMAFRPQHLADGSVIRPLVNKETPVKAKAPASKRKKNGTARRGKL